MSKLASYVARRVACVATLRRILIAQLHLELEPDEIEPDAPLFGTGLALDSVDALEIVSALEAEFRLRLEQEDIRLALRSVNTLADLVMSGQDSAGGAR